MRRFTRQGPGPCLFVFLALAAAGPRSARAHGVWTEQAAPTVLQLNAVRFYHRAEGWAAGDEGVMLRYRHGAWENAPSGTDRRLEDLAVLGTGDAWAVGEAGTIISYRRHLRVDQQQKQNIKPAGEVTTTLFNTNVDFIMVGNATWVGPLSWTIEPDADGVPALTGLFWARSGEGPFEPGEPPAGTPNPLVIRLVVDRLEVGKGVSISYPYQETNPVWRRDEQGSSLTLKTLHAVSFLTPDIGWAVGGSGTGMTDGVALRYNGAGWITATTTGNALFDVEAVADDLVWCCGGNRSILKFDGTRFTVPACVPAADAQAMRTLAFPFRSIGYVAGDGGWIWRYSSSTDCFTPVPSPVAATIRSLSLVPGSGAGYAVGDGGQRLHFNGASFEAEAAGGGDLRAVQMLNELEGVTVGGTGGPRILGLRLDTAETDLAHVRVYPNPFDPNRRETLKLDRLPGDVTSLGIFSVRGERLAGLGDGVVYNPVTGQAEWTGRVRGGKPAASGAYVWRIGTASGRHGHGIVLVAKQ